MKAEAAGQPFNTRLIAALVAAGIVAFGIFMLLMAYSGDFRSGRDGRPHALSVSAVGFKGIGDLINRTGGQAIVARTADDLDTEDLVVVALEPQVSPEALAELLEQRAAAVTLLVLPKWDLVPDPRRTGWVMSVGAGAQLPAELLGKIGKVELATSNNDGGRATGKAFLEGLSVPLPNALRTLRGKGLQPLLVTAGGETVLAELDKALYLLVDPDLLNNQGLNDPTSARAALDLLAGLNSTGSRSVVFDVTLNGFGQRPNALKLAFEPPFVALTIALFVAALLAGLHGAFRFGPEVREGPAIAMGKAALVENSAGLFRIARREHRVGGAYAELIREAAAHAAGAPAALRGAELDTYLDRLSPDEARFSHLAGRASGTATRSDLVDAAHALYLWKKELIQ